MCPDEILDHYDDYDTRTYHTTLMLGDISGRIVELFNLIFFLYIQLNLVFLNLILLMFLFFFLLIFNLSFLFNFLIWFCVNLCRL